MWSILKKDKKKSKLTKTTLGNRHVDSSFFSILPLMGERVWGGHFGFSEKIAIFDQPGEGDLSQSKLLVNIFRSMICFKLVMKVMKHTS